MRTDQDFEVLAKNNMTIIAILAMTEERIIGRDNSLAWHIPEDLKHFKDLTTGHTVVMGKNTYLSLPENVRPLPNRENIILTHSSIPGVKCFSEIPSLLKYLKKIPGKIFLIGGASLYDQFFQKNLIDQVELTLLTEKFYGNVFVDEFRENFTEIAREKFSHGFFITLQRK